MPEHDSSRRCAQDREADKAGLIALSRHEFQAGTFERSPWQAAAFSSDSEHVAGATPGHKIYAWSLHGGILAKFLEFEGEAPLDGAARLLFSPWRCCAYLTATQSGAVHPDQRLGLQAPAMSCCTWRGIPSAAAS